MNISERIVECLGEKKTFKKAFCPYRVCPIGAHIDHQLGKITGFAIDKGIEVYYIPDNNGIVELSSVNFKEKQSFHVNNVPKVKQNDWADYLRGATIALSSIRKLSVGIRALIVGSLPVGGLSSSAAVIISYLSALCEANGITLTNDEMIETALKSENQYVGVSCGKLDQSCEVLSKKDHLLYLDNKDGKYELIPKNKQMKPFRIAIFFSGVERTLVGSKFNMRVDELKSAAYALKAFSGMEYGKFNDTVLRDVPFEVFLQYKDRLPENFAKRAEHYYGEMARVEAGAEAWRRGDIEEFGRLSFESGRSSIYKYETGSPELKMLYEIMCRTDGIYGGRKTRAGFKGCCMALVDPSFEESIKEKVTREYLAEFPQLAETFSVHFCDTADGVKL